MLQTLSIHHIVIIDQLSLSFKNGLSILSGETGAGKSILMDALGLVLGMRADGKLVRKGAKKGIVTAEFLCPPHLHKILEEEALPHYGTQILLKRELSSNGRSRAFINDMPTTLFLLKKIAAHLVEIHAQGENQRLLSPQNQLQLLDQYGHCDETLPPLLSKTKLTYQHWKVCLDEKKRLESELKHYQEEMAFLEFTYEELKKLNYQEGEEKELEEKRLFLKERKQIVTKLSEVDSFLTERPSLSDRLLNAEKALTQISLSENSPHMQNLKQVEDALIQMSELLSTTLLNLKEFGYAMDSCDDYSLDGIEERLLDLKDFARKHHIQIDEIPDFEQKLKRKLEQGTKLEEEISLLTQKVIEAEKAYLANAQALHEARLHIASKLDKALNQELKALKLERARFRTAIQKLSLQEANETGLTKVSFNIQTNPGSPEGPVHEITSGGEASRIVLAMKIILSDAMAPPVFIFDEVDTGIGGAVADAVGTRLEKLAQKLQLLVITHSPQIAAKADQHYFISKINKNNATFTHVKELVHSQDRQNEIARMLSGQELTDEAKAAALNLLKQKKYSRQKTAS